MSRNRWREVQLQQRVQVFLVFGEPVGMFFLDTQKCLEVTHPAGVAGEQLSPAHGSPVAYD